MNVRLGHIPLKSEGKNQQAGKKRARRRHLQSYRSIFQKLHDEVPLCTSPARHSATSEINRFPWITLGQAIAPA